MHVSTAALYIVLCLWCIIVGFDSCSSSSLFLRCVHCHMSFMFSLAEFFSMCSIVSPLITLKKPMQHQFQSLFHTVFPSLSFSTPQSSTPLWNLERSLTEAQRKTSAVTIQICTSTWSNTTRKVWRTPSPTSRLGLCWVSYSHWLPLFCFSYSFEFCFVLWFSDLVLMVHR